MISIITVTYNSGRTLECTMQSVLAQNFTNYEYIIIDGGSTDDTLEIIHSKESLFQGKLKWLSEKDNGIYNAMNKGIKMASGNIIGILNSDDFFTSPFILSTISDSFEMSDLDAVYGDVHFVHPKNLSKTIRYYSSKFFSRRLMIFGFMPAHPTFYAKRVVFEKFGLYKEDYKIAADFEFLLRTIYKGIIKIKYIPIDMVTMRIGGASTSGIYSHRIIMKEHLRAFHENGLYTNIVLLTMRYIYKVCELLYSRLKL